MTALDIIARRSLPAAGLVAPRSGDLTVAAAGLERMRRLVAALGDPHLAYPTIHVAGSKGKGSTVAYAAAILTATGRKTGRYTSPHLMDWRERIAVDGVDISEADFDRVLTTVDATMTRLEEARPADPPHNAFELLTAAAFLHFAERNVDAAVIEVGLGGRFDSTNVVDSAVSVITSIEAEHLDILGPTLADVAWNKAGIMRPGRLCLSVDQDDEVDAVLRSEAGIIGAALTTLEHADNAELAVRAVEILIGGPLNPEVHVRLGLAAGRLPGRFEVVHGHPTVVMDVGHTPRSIERLGTDVVARFPDRPPTVLIGLLADKPADGIARAVTAWAGAVLATTPPSPRALPSSTLATALHGHPMPVENHPDPTDALSAAIDHASPDGVVVVTGSFALVAHVRRILIDHGAIPR